MEKVGEKKKTKKKTVILSVVQHGQNHLESTRLKGPEIGFNGGLL
jgi:hypothetical protein